MATLPTFTVTDAQAARIIAAFTDPNTGTPVQNYKAWLKQALIDKVTEYESGQYDLEYMAERQARKDGIVADLDTVQ